MLIESEIILRKPQFAEFFFNYFQVFPNIRLIESEIILRKPQFAEFFFNYFQVFPNIRHSFSNTVTVRVIQVNSPRTSGQAT
jgi:hypothetical protein